MNSSDPCCPRTVRWCVRSWAKVMLLPVCMCDYELWDSWHLEVNIVFFCSDCRVHGFLKVYIPVSDCYLVCRNWMRPVHTHALRNNFVDQIFSIVTYSSIQMAFRSNAKDLKNSKVKKSRICITSRVHNCTGNCTHKCTHTYTSLNISERESEFFRESLTSQNVNCDCLTSPPSSSSPVLVAFPAYFSVVTLTSP